MRSGNYLSREYQENVIKSFYKEAGFESTRGRHPFLDDLINHVARETAKHMHLLGTSSEETKNEGPFNENHLLKAYFFDLEIKIKEVLRNLRSHDTTSPECHHFLEVCIKHKRALEGMTDVSIYIVNLSDETYSKMLKASSLFFYLGKIKMAGAIFNGAVSMLPCLANRIYDVCDQTFFHRDNSVTQGLREDEFNRRKSSLQAATSRFGYSCQMNIRPEWIRSQIRSDGDFGSFEQNFSFDSSTPSPNTIYVLNANDPKKVFQEGIVYLDPSVNPLGHQIFFNDFENAHACARQLQACGFRFDRECGWHLDHAWTEEEKNAAKLKIQAAFRETGVLPNNGVAEIVEGYLGIETPVSSAPRPGKR